MRAFTAAAIAAAIFADSIVPAFAFDPSTSPGWQAARAPAAVAYFKLPFHPAETADAVAYGIALTAPTLRGYGAMPLSIADTPKLVDLRFNGAAPDTLRFSGQLAWAQDTRQMPDGQHFNLIGSALGLALGLAGTAASIWGIYSLVEKKKGCPAGQVKSASTGACVAA